VGLLYGKYELLDALDAYKVRPAPDEPPGKFETGTQNHEGIAGVLGAVEYLESLEVGSVHGNSMAAAMRAIQKYEQTLSEAFLAEFSRTPGVTVYGLSRNADVARRTPTFSFTIDGVQSREAAARLGKAGINVWDGHYYALETYNRLNVAASGGMVRAGAVHYNTIEEIRHFGNALREIVKA